MLTPDPVLIAACAVFGVLVALMLGWLIDHAQALVWTLTDRVTDWRHSRRIRREVPE